MLETHNVLFLSTAHLDPETGQDPNPEWASMSGEYGFLVYAGKEVGPKWHLSDAPECVQKAAAFAIENGCTYICFDRDVPVIDELQTWDW